MLAKKTRKRYVKQKKSKLNATQTVRPRSYKPIFPISFKNRNGMLGIIIGSISVVLAIIGLVLFVNQKKHDAAFQKRILSDMEILKNKFNIDPYLDGIPNLKDKNKQILIEEAIKEFNASRFDSAIIKFKQYLQIFRISDKERSAILNLMGVAQYFRSKNRDAIDTFLEMELIARRINNNEALGQALGNIGISYIELGDFTKALEYEKKALAIFKKMGDDFGVAGSLSNIGTIYKNIGRTEEALDYFKEAYDLDSQRGSRRGIAYCLENMGLAFYDLSKLDEALKYFKKAMEMHKINGIEMDISGNLVNQGLIYDNMGMPERAIKLYKEALEINRKIGFENRIGTILGNMAGVYHDLGNQEEALKLYEEARQIFEKTDDKLGIARNYGNIGLLYHDLGNQEEALKNLKIAVDISTKIGFKKGIVAYLSMIGTIYRDLNKLEEAMTCFVDALEMARIANVEIKVIKALEKNVKELESFKTH